MNDNQIAVLPQYNNLNDLGGEEYHRWQNNLSSATDSLSISENNKINEHDRSADDKDFDFIRKHAANADPEFIHSLLDSQADNPKRLEAVCEMLGIANASSLIQEFKQNSAKPGDKRTVVNLEEDPSDSKKAKKTDKEGYLQQLRDMFPDADGLFLISECQQLESENDFSRFVNTVMLSGLYPKQGYVEVEYSPITDLPKVVDIVSKDEYRTVVNYSSEEEISSSGLIESPRLRGRRMKEENRFLQPPVVDVIDISSDTTESYDPPDLDVMLEVNTLRNDAGEKMYDVYDAGMPLQSDEPGPSGVNAQTSRRQTLSNLTISTGEKSLAEIIEEKRSNVRRSIASTREFFLATSKDSGYTKEDVSVLEVSTTSQPEPEAGASVNTDSSEKEWLDEQTANLIRIFPNTDPSYLREEVSKMDRSSTAVNEFVVAKLEKNDMPTRADYEKKLEMEELQNRYKKNFSIEDFLKAVPDPWEYFSDTNRNCSKYQNHSLCYLKSNFRKLYVKDILQAFNNNKNNLYLTYQALKKQEAKARNHRRSEFECNRGRPTTIDVQFLQEVAFIENEDRIKEYLEAEKIARQIKFDEAKKTGSLLECQCCFDAEILVEDIFYCPQDHAFCRDCVTKSVEVEMGNGRYQFECLSNCNEKFTLACLQNALQPELFSKVIRAIQMEEIRAAGIEDLVQCPFCNYATIMPPEEKVMVCLNPECLKESCRSCKELNHIPLRCEEVEKSEEVKMRTYIENKMTEALVRTCYKCGKKFVKDDGCNKMTCTCGAKMCYVCRKPVTAYSHFNAQGGTEYHKCPLYSMNDELHVDLVKRVAEEAKAEILQANPEKKLFYDPTIIMPERSNQHPIPGINNGTALDVAMRAIREENDARLEEGQGEIRGSRRRRRNPFPPRRPPIRIEEVSDSDTETEEENPVCYFLRQRNHHREYYFRHRKVCACHHHNIN